MDESERKYQFDSTSSAIELINRMESDITVYEEVAKEAQRKIEAVKDELNILASGLLLKSSKEDSQALAELAAELYWFHQKSVRANVITAAVQATPQNITSRISAALLQVTCPTCGNEWHIRIKSRNALKDAMKTPYRQCPNCKAEQDAINKANGNKYIREYEENIRHLRSMPYDEYLKTDHWQEVRQKMLKKADYRCQLCNISNVSLHVHHRTYINRGCEQYSDLIVLCSNCHARFHDKLESAS